MLFLLFPLSFRLGSSGVCRRRPPQYHAQYEEGGRSQELLHDVGDISEKREKKKKKKPDDRGLGCCGLRRCIAGASSCYCSITIIESISPEGGTVAARRGVHMEGRRQLLVAFGIASLLSSSLSPRDIIPVLNVFFLSFSSSDSTNSPRSPRSRRKIRAPPDPAPRSPPNLAVDQRLVAVCYTVPTTSTIFSLSGPFRGGWQRGEGGKSK